MNRRELEDDVSKLAVGLKAADERGDTEAAMRLASAFRKAKGQLDLMVSNPAEYDPESDEYKEKYGAASPYAAANVAAGAGKFLFDRARGIGQILGVTDQESVDEAKMLDRDLMGTKSGIAGNILGGAAFSAPAALIPGANTALGATVLGGAIGATDPVASGGSRALNTVIGGAGGLVGQRAGQFLMRSRPNVTGADDIAQGLNRAQQRVLAEAQDVGFAATPGQATGNKALQQLEAALESKPFTSGPITAIKEGNQSNANRLFNEAIGEIGDTVDDTVIDDALSRLGGVFDDARNIPDQPIDPADAFGFLKGISDELRNVTSTPVLNHPLAEEFISLVEGGQATGRQLRSLTSRLGKKVSSLFTTPGGDRELAGGLAQIKQCIDGIILDGMDGAQRESYLTAMRQYRLLTSALSRNNVINPSSGNINLNALASVLRKNDKSGFLRGNNRSPLYTAARFGQAFRPIVGDSGTATRNVGALDFIAGLPPNLASRIYFSQPATAIASQGSKAIGKASQAAGPLVDPRILALLGAGTALNSN